MGKIGLAFRAFFRVLLSREVAAQVETLFRDEALPKIDAAPEAQRGGSSAKAPPRSAGRSDALTLLSALQREARFLDLVQEPLAGYADAQVGAAARDVLRNCHDVLARLFEIKPVVEQEEQTTIEVPAGFSPARFRLTGNVHGEPPFRGILAHRGWQATRCQIPEWSGDVATQMIVSPAEVELK